MSYEAIAAWAGLLAALAAILAIWSESRRHRAAMALELILRLEDQFDNDRYRNYRQRAALTFQKAKCPSSENAIDEIVNFFDGVGYFVVQGILPKELMWHWFSYYLLRFWHFAGEYVESERRRDPTIWREFIQLHRQMESLERGERLREGIATGFGEDDLRQFLNEEINLA